MFASTGAEGERESHRRPRETVVGKPMSDSSWIRFVYLPDPTVRQELQLRCGLATCGRILRGETVRIGDEFFHAGCAPNSIRSETPRYVRRPCCIGGLAARVLHEGCTATLLSLRFAQAGDCQWLP